MFRLETINRRLILYIILFSSAITVLTTATQLFFDYRHDVALIEEHFKEIRATHLTGLEASMWVMDVKQVQTMLEGVVRLRDIQYLSISDHSKLVAAAGEEKADKTVEKNFLLERSYEGQTVVLGTLRVVASLEGVYQRLIDKVIVILVSNAIKTFSVACFFYWIFQRLLTRHLTRIANYARNLLPDKADDQLRLERVRAQDAPADELDQVVESINEMQENLVQSYQALARSEDVYARAQKAANIGTWDWDIKNDTLEWSEHIAPIFGLEHDNFENRYEAFMRLVHPDDRVMVEEAVAATVETQVPYAIDHRIVWPNGIMRWVSEQGEVQLDDEGHAVRMIGVVQDITERKENEAEILRLNQTLEKRVEERTAQLVIATEEMEAFSYSVSHDLRAPLRSITGFSSILLEEATALPEELQAYLQNIADSGNRMHLLIEDLLTFFRLNRNKMRVQSVDLGGLFREVAEELAVVYKHRQVDLKIDDIMQCEGDPSLLKQVASNLLDNAFKYTGRCEQAIIEVGIKKEESGTVYFVRDNGAGFDMRYADKLFGVFQRLHRSDEFEGTGIGLALSQRIIRRHGGQIWAEAEVDKGATFYFTISPPA